MHLRAALAASVLLVLGTMLVGCSADAGEEVDDVSGAASARPDVRFRSVSFDVPAAHAKTEANEIFSSEDELRKHFGESCGYFCTKPYEGRLSFQINDPPDKQVVAVYINKADVPAGRELVITGIERKGNPKWLHVSTCTRPGPYRPYAFALAVVDGTQPLIWASGPERGEGLQACR